MKSFMVIHVIYLTFGSLVASATLTPLIPIDISLTLGIIHVSSLVSNHTPRDISFMIFTHTILLLHEISPSMKTIFHPFTKHKPHTHLLVLLPQHHSPVTMNTSSLLLKPHLLVPQHTNHQPQLVPTLTTLYMSQTCTHIPPRLPL